MIALLVAVALYAVLWAIASPILITFQYDPATSPKGRHKLAQARLWGRRIRDLLLFLALCSLAGILSAAPWNRYPW